jgi:hypothetical protein
VLRDEAGEMAEGAVARGLRNDVDASEGEGKGLVDELFGEEAGRSRLAPGGGNLNESGGCFEPNMPLLD